MEQPTGRWWRPLDVVSLGLFLIAAVYFAYRVVVSRHDLRREAQIEHRAGESIDDISRLHLGKAGLTALIVISPVCRYCKESVPLYRELDALAGSHQSALKLVFVTVGDEAATKQMLEEGGLSGHELLQRPERLRIGVVPTVLLADASGKVKGVWVGRLDGSSRSELLRSVRAAASL